MGEIHHAEYANFSSSDKREALEQVLQSYDALVEGQTNWVCNLSNASSLIWHAYQSLNVPVNWAGFYVLNPEVPGELILGPFQGKVACQTIKIGHGVCGTAVSQSETQVVPDVNKFPGHIACDGETQSEIVVPIISSNSSGEKTVQGVLDIDCLALQGFDSIDQEILEKIVNRIAQTCKW